MKIRLTWLNKNETKVLNYSTNYIYVRVRLASLLFSTFNKTSILRPIILTCASYQTVGVILKTNANQV